MKPTIVCPACKATFSRYLEAPLVFGCPSCGLPATRNAAGVLEPGLQLPTRVQFYSPEWLKPGARLRWKHKVYTVFSAMVYESKWNEWDAEDNCWEKGTSQSMEWYAIADDDSELCIEYDDKKHFLRENLNWAAPGITDKLASGDKAGWVEYGTFVLKGMVGEDDEPLDTRLYQYAVLNAKGHRSDVFVEWPDSDPNTKSFYTYTHLPPTKLRQMRMSDSAIVENAAASLPRLSFLRYAFGFAALFFLALSIWGLAGQKPLVKSYLNFSNMVQDSTFRAPRSLGTFKVEKDHAYAFSASCLFTTPNSGADFSVDIVRLPEGTPVNTIACSFYTESGRDNEGDWTESTLEDDFYFRAAEDGTYELIAYADSQYNEGLGSGAVSGTFRASVAPLLLTRYYLVCMLLMTLVWLIFQWQLENARLMAETGDEPWLHKLKDSLSQET